MSDQLPACYFQTPIGRNLREHEARRRNPYRDYYVLSLTPQTSAQTMPWLRKK